MTDPFREFADDVKGLATELVRLIHADRDIVPMVTFRRDGFTDSIGVDARYFTDEGRDYLLSHAILPFIEVMRPQLIAWTFTGRRGTESGFWEHEVAATVVIDRERAEVWESRLVRHDNIATLGAWRPWPVEGATGLLVAPIQEVLR